MRRLCQELLSEVTGRPITAVVFPQVELPKFSGGAVLGNPGNPWGRAGKPRLEPCN